MSDYIYFVSVVQYVASILVLLSAWFLGVVKVFKWANNKFISLPEPVRYVVAVALAFISLFIVFIWMPIGISEMFRRFGTYMERLSVEYAMGDKNIPLWYKIIINEHTGLILAYIVIPLHVLLLRAAIWELSGMTVPFTVIDMLFVYIPPTVIRFMLKPQGFEYVSEIFFYIVVSFLCSSGFYYVFYSLLYLPTIFDEVFVCLVLSYKSERKEDGSKLISYSMYFFLVVLAFIRRIVRHGKPTSEALMSSAVAFLIVFPFIFYFVSTKTHKRPDSEQDNTTAMNGDNIGRQISQINYKQPEQPREPSRNSNTGEQTTHSNQPPKPRQEPEPPQPPLHDKADTLIDIGLACIGRVTALDNPYITPEQTQSRHNVERPFLSMLSERYTDKDTRKALARHFMLYKEFTLFVIFAMVLENYKPLHTKIRSRLKIRLSQGLPSNVIAKRNEYWRKLSEKFHESYTRTHDLAGTLNYVFWSVLPEKLKGESFADLVGNGCLMQIFNYTRNAVAQKYNNLTKEN